MNIRYYHEFRGLDNVLNRFEILTEDVVSAMEIKASPDALSLEYSEARKLDPIRGSQATMNLISESVFQFVDLHTDEMRKYLVKFYRAGSLYWMGWLDSELYGEELSATPPYGVTFKASDFNIMERLRYRDGSENRYIDIVPFITHIRRCLDKLGLPFNKLYIGCTTSAEGVALSASETVLHQLYMMSDNFYDEDKEPMSCREVMEEILRPFGLMLVHKYGDLYIYDYNTLKGGLPMKRYGYSTFAYEADETVNFNLGNLHVIGFASTDSSYGFEEMINNVKITSSLYANKDLYNNEISEKTLEDKKSSGESGDKYTVDYYSKDANVENLNNRDFVVYTNTDNNSTLIGATLPYDPKTVTYYPQFRFKSESEWIIGNSEYSLNIKISAYANTRINPFTSDTPPGDTSRAKVLWLKCNLYIMDKNNETVCYYNNGPFMGGWISTPKGWQFPHGAFELFFTPAADTWNGEALNKWITNSNMSQGMSIGAGYPPVLAEKNVGVGQVVLMKDMVNGYVVFEITNGAYVDHPGGQGYPYIDVKNIIINNLSVSIADKNGKEISTDDYEFNSYINKNVKTDFEEVTLKCISANEEKAPIGKANVLRKTGNGYGLQLAFTRSGQKDILERLLMCTIHSNFTTKNGKLTVDIKMTDNPALGYVDYEPILSGTYLVIGCKLDFSEAKTTVTAVGYSGDTDKLSSIPYD